MEVEGEESRSATGGWEDIGVTKSAMDALISAVGNEQSYSEGTTRVCVKSIRSVEQQVVAGVLYSYQVDGCALQHATNNGWCIDGGDQTDCGSYQVQVFSQPWTNTLRVNSVDF